MLHLNVIMGPSGCGKSSIALELAQQTGWVMIEADDHHPESNVEKQRNRIPLTDEDRIAWLDNLLQSIHAAPHKPIVLACSALTPYVQKRLRSESKRTCIWWLLDVSREGLHQRLQDRQNHFMPVDLLDSQLDSLAPPSDVRKVNGEQSITDICAEILNYE